MKITVVAKVTAGTHPKHGAITQGQTYEIEEEEFAEELFERKSESVGAGFPRPDQETEPPSGKTAKKRRK